MTRPEPNNDTRRSQPSGFTLLELMLVLGIVVSLTTLSWPRMQRSLVSAEHRAAAETLQTELMQLRLIAIESGKPQWFRFQEGGNEYLLETLPYDEVKDIDFENSPTRDENAEDHEGYSMVRTGIADISSENEFSSGDAGLLRLSGDVVFLASLADFPPKEDDLSQRASTVSSETRRGFSATGMEADHFVKSSWSSPILFYPDGRSEDSSIVVADRNGYLIVLTVVGITGDVQISARRRLPQTSDREK